MKGNERSIPWSLFDGSDSEDEEDSVLLSSEKEEEIYLDDFKFHVYFRHHHVYFPFTVMLQWHVVVNKYWYKNVMRFCTHVSLRRNFQGSLSFTHLSRPRSLICCANTSMHTLRGLISSWRDSLEQIVFPHIHRDIEYRTILQMMQVHPVVLDLSNCDASVLTFKCLESRASRLVKLNMCVGRREGLTDSDVSNVLRHAPVLRFLNLSGNSNLSMRCLRGSITKTLENLSLEGLFVDSDSWREEIIGKHRHSLRALNLSQMCVRDRKETSFVFSGLSKLLSLRTLGLANIERRFLPGDLPAQLSRIPNLKELDLSHSNYSWISDFSIGKSVFLHSLQVLWLRHSNISDNELLSIIHMCPKLTDLDIGECATISDDGLSAALCKMRAPLKRLVIDNQYGMCAWNLNGSGLCCVLKKHADRVLALSVSNQQNLASNPNWYKFLSRQLLRLNVCRLRELNLDVIRNRCHRLKKLVLDDCICITEFDLLRFVTTWSSLRILSLARLKLAVTDRVVKKIAEQNSLHRLDIQGCTSATVASILSVEMSTFQKLQYLNIQDLPLVGGRYKTYKKLAYMLPSCDIIWFS